MTPLLVRENAWLAEKSEEHKEKWNNISP